MILWKTQLEEGFCAEVCYVSHLSGFTDIEKAEKASPAPQVKEKESRHTLKVLKLSQSVA